MLINLLEGSYVVDGENVVRNEADLKDFLTEKEYEGINKEEAKKGTIAYGILDSHNSGDDESLEITFDSLTSHDITFVGIIQTARTSGMKEFPVPFVMTNCHNSLCAVGGTINEDDHKFGLSAAKKYGGIYVPPNLAVIHSYNREMMTKAGGMILGSDSHTRYGALGTLAVGEGGGELVKQLLGQKYDMKRPEVVAVKLTGEPKPGVGPQDVALTLIKAVFQNNFAQNKVLEFIGDGIENLPVEYRNGIDVMTTETACWSSIWQTDEAVRDYYIAHGREEDYKELKPAKVAYYDGIVELDLSKVEPSIALPFHPSNVYTIEEFKANAEEILDKVDEESKAILGVDELDYSLKEKLIDGEFYVEQGIVGGCSGGTYDNVLAVADILKGNSIGNGEFSLSVYPGSQPAYLDLVNNGSIGNIMAAGGLVRSAFCGPCFGAGDTPANNELSIRHNTRNFPNREGSKPAEGQLSLVALMDARSIAATAINGGKLTGADTLDVEYSETEFAYNPEIYEKRVYNGFGKADPSVELQMGPNIKDWPEMPELEKDLLVKVVTYIDDEVTTTDELIPSGETSSYRSDPFRLAEFTLSRKDPNYVENAKEVHEYEKARQEGNISEDLKEVYDKIKSIEGFENREEKTIGIGSTIYAHKPGDGSAREQAASCQRVLGASANIAKEYATKRYRTNLINWGIIPFLIEDEDLLAKDDYVFIPNVREELEKGTETLDAYVIGEDVKKIELKLGDLNADEREKLASGSLINHNRQ